MGRDIGGSRCSVLAELSRFRAAKLSVVVGYGIEKTSPGRRLPRNPLQIVACFTSNAR
jgi:hypothetical protein